MLFVSRSNSLHVLADRLASVLETPGLAPLEAECILIQTAGIQRWLSRELAKRLGVLAGARFPFPRSFLREVIEGALGPAPQAERYEREALTWLVFRLLGESKDRPGFESVRRFLERDGDGTERFLLAERIANLFDQYSIYRPALLTQWEKGTEPLDFQACLWRGVTSELGPAHFVARSLAMLENVNDEQLRALLPPRISLVGGPGLPPVFLEILERLGRAIDVHVFSFSVCQEYFADAHPEDELLPEIGQGLHPLLVSWGRVGAEFQKLIERHDYTEASADYVPPTADTVLAHLQRDILEGRVRPAEEWLGAAHREDTSITLDVCHGPLREVETLYDRLLGYFADDPTLREEDVVVLVPKIEEYSPLISAVFGARPGADGLLSFRVADRNERSDNPAAAAFLLALATLSSRFRASSVLDLLQTEPVRSRFEVDASELERIARWVAESGVRWGLDGAHRAEFDLPDEDQNTWKQGLERLWLGFALSDDGATEVGGVVPFDDVPARDGATLGKLGALIESLERARRSFTEAGKSFDDSRRSAVEWCELVRDWIPSVLATSRDGAGSLESVFDAISVVKKRASAAGVDEPVPLALVVRLFEHELAERRPSTDFLTGGVTFCELLPLRTIPFRVVAVLGLNQGEFPRADRTVSFDKMKADHRPGDRSIRADDRYLFLEMLLAARDRLSLSYVGRSIQDNSEKPPSVLVTELSQTLDALFEPSLRAAPYLKPRLHPLQPFSPSYFDGSRAELSSTSTEWLDGARALLETDKTTTPLWSSAAMLELELEREISLEELVRFFKNPAAAFLDVVGVRLDDEVETLEDREPVRLDPLTRYGIGSRLLDDASKDRATSPTIERGRGELPSGTPGQVALEDLGGTIEELVQVARPWRQEPREPAPFVLDLGKILGGERTLRGTLDSLYGAARVEVTYGKLSVKRRLATWIRHLAASAAQLGVERSVLIGRSANPYRERDAEDTIVYEPIDADVARTELVRLVELALGGRRSALRFHPEASWALWQKMAKGPLGEDAAARDGLLTLLGSKLKDPLGRDRITGENLGVIELFGEADPFGVLESVDVPLEELEVSRHAVSVFATLARHEVTP